MAAGTGNILIHKLDEFIRKYYKNQLIRGGLYATALLISTFLVVVGLESLGEFNTVIRSILFYGFLGTTVFVVVNYIAIPLAKLNKFGKIISYEEAAQIIGTHFSNVQDKLLNVLQLQNSKALTGSDELLVAGINQKISELHPVPFTSAIDLSDNKKYLKFVLPPLFITTALFIIWPQIITNSTRRLVHHQTYFEKSAPFQFSIQNPDLKAIQQQDFVLKVKLSGSEIPNEVFMTIDGNEFRLDKENNINFSYTFKNVQANTPFSLNAAGFRSKDYELKVLAKPALMQFNVLLKYPAYLNKKDERIANTGDLQVPQGTKIQWEFNTKNTDRIHLAFNDTTLDLEKSGNDKFSFLKRLMRSTSYSIKTSNALVERMGDSVNYSINVMPDQVPLIDVSEKTDSLNFKNIYFSGSIKDDYGFNTLSFHYTYYTTDSSGNSQVKNGQAPIGINRAQISQPYFYFFDASQFNLKPGDKIDYYFEVWDNDGVNGAKPARTKVMSFKAPTQDEINESTSKNNTEIKNDLEESLKKAKQLQKDLNDLSKKMNDKKQIGWEEKKKIEDVLNKQKDLQKKVDEIKQENQQNNQQQNQFNQQDESIVEKQKQLEKLFDNVMTPEMKKLFDELQKLMNQLDKNQVQQKLEEMKLNNKDIEKELDRALEAFKQLEVEQKMQQAIDKLDELVKKEDQLNKETEGKKETKESEKTKETKGTEKTEEKKETGDKNQDKETKGAEEKKESGDKNKDSKNQDKKADSKELQKKQDDIGKQFDELKKDMQELEKKNAELEQPNPMPKTEEAQKEVSQDMQNSSDELGKNNKKNASKPQKDASKKMEEMKNAMQMAMDEMENEQQEENAKALRQIMENLLNLSFAQEDLIKQLPKTRVDNPQYLKIPQQQKKLQDDSKVIEDSLLALSKRAPQLEAMVNREISSIHHNMQKTVESLAERMTSDAGMRMQNSMTSINNLALLLNESLDQMQKQMKDKKQGNGSKCKKPGSGSNPSSQGKKPASMSQMQQQLNKQLQELKNALEKGQKPGEKPGQGQKPGQKPGMGMGPGQGQQGPDGMQMPGTSEQLAKMAAQQEALRRQIQEMMSKLKNKGSSPGGDIADMMEQTEKDIVNKSLTNETMKRQQQILTRLLESEKAEKEREQDEQRKSNEAKNEILSNPNQFLEYKRMKEKELELLNTVPPSLTPFYKEKVNTYFNSVSK